MKILSLLWGFSLGGIGKCALTYARLDNWPGISFKTVCIYGTGWNCDLTPLNEIEAFCIPIEKRSDFSWVGRCVKIIEEYDPDLLFVHGFNGPVIAMVIQMKLKKNLPFVCSYHGLYHPPTFTRIFLAPIFNQCLGYIYRQHATAIVGVAQYCKKTLCDRGIQQEKISVVYNGLSLHNDARHIDRQSLGISKNDVIIGIVSRLDPIKGIDYVIEAFASVVKKYHNVHLLIIGDGAYKKRLEKKCETLHVQSNVKFLGFQKNINDWLELMDIYVLASLNENHSIALLEAMRASKAIVVTDAGGNTESVFHKVHGLVVPPRDPYALEKEMIRFIKDPLLRTTLGKNARKRFEEKFTETQMLQGIAHWLFGCKRLVPAHDVSTVMQ